MALERGIKATMKNEMTGLLELKSHNLTQGANWLLEPPSQIAGNSDGHFVATLLGSDTLTGTVVYVPHDSTTELTFTFTVDGTNNTAQATYPTIGPTVSAQITQGANAIATFSYYR